MPPETKNHRQGATSCQNCKSDFTIESDDFAFYEKIKVPPPTFCPRCRMVRRFANSNERVLYRRKCDLTNKDIMSMYPADAPFPVYDVDAWYGDGWDPYEYGMDYDFSRPFFEQFKELKNKVPHMALVRQGRSINSEYCHRIDSPKNCYLIFRATNNEDCSYLYVSIDTKDCLDSSFIYKSERCYECIGVENCYNLTFSQESTNCQDSSFLYGCHNCSNCIGCVNLRNAKYNIFNKQYTKEEYENKIKELALNTYEGIEKMKKIFDEFRKKYPQKSTNILKSNNYSGNWFTNCQNVENSFFCGNVKDGKHLFTIFDAQDCYDFSQWGNNAEMIYESENCGINISRLSFCNQCWAGAHDLTYCDSCPGAGNCFGCVGLKKGEYSILNKKYTKEEYDELVPKIKQHMMEMPYIDTQNRKYKFGEHFPFEFSFFAYNETGASDFFPLSREEAQRLGYKWKEREKTKYPISIESSKLPQTISEVKDSILKEIISCEESEKEYSPGAFKITSEEYSFYKKMNLPLPRVSYPVRHMRRLKKIPSLEIINRLCTKCSKEVSTVYKEDYAPILYCESCYLSEII